MALGRVPFPSEMLNRKDAAEYLCDLGYAVSPHALACWAGRRGPGYLLLGKRAVYLASDVYRWAQRQFEKAKPR